MRKFNVIIDGVSYGVEVEESLEVIEKEATLNAIAENQIKSEEPKAKPEIKPEAKIASKGGTALKSPMPGMIMGFKVANGAAVKKGQAVISLEAMKMENDISASADGVITFVAVKGANVNTGDILAYIA